MVKYTVKRTFIEFVESPTSSEEGEDELAFGHALTDGAVRSRSLKRSLSDEEANSEHETVLETSSEYEMLSEATETSSACGLDQPETNSVFEGEMTPWPDSYGLASVQASQPVERPAVQPVQPADRSQPPGFVQVLMPVSVQAVPLQFQVLSLGSALPPSPPPTPPPTPQRAAAVRGITPAPPVAAVASTSSSFSSGSSLEQPKAWRTTIMLRNLPNNYTRQDVLRMLDEEGFAGLYDFLYLPIDFKTQACFGYCFVNLISPEVALRCWSTFEGFSRWVLPSRKCCYVSWSGPHQGLEDHVKWYRGSAILHSSVPDEYKPVLFSGGVRVPFPAPRKATRAPKTRAAGTAPSGRRGSKSERRT